MKLELKHLAPYLPYRLGYKTIYCEDIIKQIVIDSFNNMAETYICGFKTNERIDKIKPILRPLSDLTKSFEHEGVNIKPIIKSKSTSIKEFVYKISYFDFQSLLAFHFDVFGLIEKGLAIDINTL